MMLSKFALALLFFATFPALSNAETASYFDKVVEEPIDEVWLNPGFYSYHFQADKNLNNINQGFGVEYRVTTTNSFTAGRFNNSERKTSNYVAWIWQPIGPGTPVGPGTFRLGALLGMIDGYPRANNGYWFPLLLPVASYEYKYIGVNLTFVPTIQDTLYGAFSLQIKFKVY